MDKQKVLEKAIQKALDNGWQTGWEEAVESFEYSTADDEHYVQMQPYIRFNLEGDGEWSIGIFGLMYRHEFAQALWPKHDWKTRDDGLCGSCGVGFGYAASSGSECWKEHLQQMVIADDPIEYLAANMPT